MEFIAPNHPFIIKLWLSLKYYQELAYEFIVDIVKPILSGAKTNHWTHRWAEKCVCVGLTISAILSSRLDQQCVAECPDVNTAFSPSARAGLRQTKEVKSFAPGQKGVFNEN